MTFAHEIIFGFHKHWAEYHWLLWTSNY